MRKLASEHNVDLRQVAGSGAGGRVTKDDILAFVERAKIAPRGAAPSVLPGPVAEKIAAAPAPCGSQQICGHARRGGTDVGDAQENC